MPSLDYSPIEEASKMPTYYLFIGLAVLLIIFMIVTTILNYHWREYGYDEKVIAKARWIYYLGSIVLFSLVIVGIIIYFLA